MDGQDPRAWFEVRREVYLDEVETRWMIRFFITRMDGVTLELTDEVANMLVLAQLIMTSCGLVPAGVRGLEPLASRVEEVVQTAQDLLAVVPAVANTNAKLGETASALTNG